MCCPAGNLVRHQSRGRARLHGRSGCSTHLPGCAAGLARMVAGGYRSFCWSFCSSISCCESASAACEADSASPAVVVTPYQAQLLPTIMPKGCSGEKTGSNNVKLHKDGSAAKPAGSPRLAACCSDAAWHKKRGRLDAPVSAGWALSPFSACGCTAAGMRGRRRASVCCASFDRALPCGMQPCQVVGLAVTCLARIKAWREVAHQPIETGKKRQGTWAGRACELARGGRLLQRFSRAAAAAALAWPDLAPAALRSGCAAALLLQPLLPSSSGSSSQSGAFPPPLPLLPIMQGSPGACCAALVGPSARQCRPEVPSSGASGWAGSAPKLCSAATWLRSSSRARPTCMQPSRLQSKHTRPQTGGKGTPKGGPQVHICRRASGRQGSQPPGV